MDWRHIETLNHRAPLGLRCTDSATGQNARDGLALSLLSSANPGRVATGQVTPSGNYGFGRLGILLPDDLAHPDGPLKDWEYDPSVEFRSVTVNGVTLADKKEFALICEDRQERFLSCALKITLDKSSVATVRSMPLFSAPARPPVPGLTIVRGQVKQSAGAAHVPARGVQIAASYAQNPAPLPAMGISDARGVFALFLPPPAPDQITSPAGTPYADRTATLTLTFHFEPAKQVYVCVSPDNIVKIVGGSDPKLAERQAAGWRCYPDQASLLAQSTITTKSVAVSAIRETVLSVTDNADPTDQSVWLS